MLAFFVPRNRGCTYSYVTTISVGRDWTLSVPSFVITMVEALPVQVQFTWLVNVQIRK